MRSSLSAPKRFFCAKVGFLPMTNELPNNIITVGVKRFRHADVLFQPSFQPSGFHVSSFQTWNATFMLCDQAARIGSRFPLL